MTSADNARGAPHHKGDETLKYGDATVEIALAQHSTIPPGLVEAYGALPKQDERTESRRRRVIQRLSRVIQMLRCGGLMQIWIQST